MLSIRCPRFSNLPPLTGHALIVAPLRAVLDSQAGFAFFLVLALCSGACGERVSANGDHPASGAPLDGSHAETADAPPEVIATWPDAAPAEHADGGPVERPETSRDAASDASLDGQAPAHTGCQATPPATAMRAPGPRQYSGGACPELGAGRNELVSFGTHRSFLLVAPRDPRPGEQFPVIFAWHWLGGTADDFMLGDFLQQIVDARRFIAVIPDSKEDIEIRIPFVGDFGLPWPFVIMLPDARMVEEFDFFDDMLACVADQYPVNIDCVSSIGISAGALFTAQLASARSQYLASFVSLSGGVRSTGALSNWLLRDWHPASRALPAMIAWGGSHDRCIDLDFEAASIELEDELEQQGNFFVECVHNCGHGVWFDFASPDPSAVDAFNEIIDFIYAHPYWLPEGSSPYIETRTLDDLPPWCGIGAASATPRSGPCPPPKC